MPPFWGLGMFYGSQQTDSLKHLQSLISNNSKLEPDLPAEGNNITDNVHLSATPIIGCNFKPLK